MHPQEKYQNDLGEKIPLTVFDVFYRLKLEKIPESLDNLSPDYAVRDESGVLIARCEVKSLIDVIGPADLSIDMDHAAMAEKMRRLDRNHRSKLRGHHEKAISQLTKYSDLPTIVFFVSFDMTDHIDLLMMLQDNREIFPEAERADLYILMKVYLGTIPTGEFQITQSALVADNTERGTEFANKYLSWDKALRNAGIPV